VNVCVAVYLAVFLTPTILDTAGALADLPWVLPACLIVIAVACFSILQAIGVIFFTGHFRFLFPKIFDTLGAALLGFLAAFLAGGFLAFVGLTIPFCRQSAFAPQLAHLAQISVVRTCNSVHFLSCQSGEYSPQDVIESLLYTSPRRQNIPPSEPQEPDLFHSSSTDQP
jgi:uncharacterized integral membrane protein